MNCDRLTEHLLDLELRLLRPEVRRNQVAVRLLLAEEFCEIAASGRVLDREAVVAELQRADSDSLTLSNFHCRALGEQAALVTYVATRTDAKGAQRLSRRSSVWVLRDERWQCLFHQGTATT